MVSKLFQLKIKAIVRKILRRNNIQVFKLFLNLDFFFFFFNVCNNGFAQSYSFLWYVVFKFVSFGRTESKIKEMNGTQDTCLCS